ncbi:uncharacterized protein LOC128264437 [Drosophila gunungcola]|uniref:Uncharacterized protein n=1 Tax=Drosophila gunungcola TaxID=103775 RepID=A0A9Q0BK99_9MUSC|nr:uncharacterized protein LOC128264437 [Drosophila gunungcola]KAI8034534.1 hypothetical protein M5D96_012721 [Drosophila gunungcola]
MFLGFLVDLCGCRRFSGDGMMEFPSTPHSTDQIPPKFVAVVLPTPPPLTIEIIRNPLAPEQQECYDDDGSGFDDPRLPEIII